MAIFLLRGHFNEQMPVKHSINVNYGWNNYDNPENKGNSQKATNKDFQLYQLICLGPRRLTGEGPWLMAPFSV